MDGIPRHVRELRPRAVEEGVESLVQNQGHRPPCSTRGASMDVEPLILRFGNQRQTADRAVAGPAGDVRPLRRSERVRRRPDRLSYS